MLKNKLNILTLINLLLIILLTVFVLYNYTSKSEKIVYVNNSKLFEEFKMTKEMKTIGEKEFTNKKTFLDSLYAQLQGNLNEQEKELLMKEFVSKREEFDQFNQTFVVEESDKIWSRINSYAKDFSKENNYNLIIGSNNKQDILFADESIDVTKELLDYLNKKYSGL